MAEWYLPKATAHWAGDAGHADSQDEPTVGGS